MHSKATEEPGRGVLLGALSAAGSGALLVLTFPKFNLYPLGAFALAPLLMAAAKEAAAGRRFLFGMLCGCVFFAGTCYWIYGVMRNFGGLGVAASAGVFVLFFLYLSTYFGVFSWLAWYLWKAPWGPLAIPFLWVAIEFARDHVLSGFPWLLLGYALTNSFELARVARWTGVYGLSYLLAALNVAWVWFFLRSDRWSGIHLGAVLCILAAVFFTASRETYSEDQKAYLVQTNIPEAVASESWTPASQSLLLARLRALTVESVGRQQPPALVLWPETPAPFYFDGDNFSRPYAEGIARETHSYFLLGIVAFVPGFGDTMPLNSTVLLDPNGGVVSQYDKIHLVPFGEYVPLKRWLGFAGKLTAEVSDFVPGSRYVVSSLLGGRMGGFICYEAVFPELARRFVKDGAEVLINTSNDGWYGSSAARYQHLLMARMRAIENARYLLRATNTGITAVIRPDGRIADELAPDQPAVLAGKWAFQQRQTFYTRHGDWFATGSCLAAMFACAACWRERRKSKPRSQDTQTETEMIR